ncbi:MAG TPA: hypothetical protein IAA61_05720 [Candidatus Ornithomonoglobus merdipullorum]|uniref:Uncharacterized protein n=1 Tax=Candidatus Ornithomonoglobus merdipullorum TaxID=2840895 RepID=A0A9D1MBR8_9FIRM|nr:hypothetical protein [Candidatus Ornithomonoglobus merdipullorum]
MLREGVININQGVLDIDGDFIIADGTAIDTAGEMYYVAADACIRMTDYRDKVIVNGDFITYGEDHSGCLTAGTLEIKGDFEQNGDPDSFNATGDHKTIFSGSGLQEIFFNNAYAAYSSGSDFSRLQIANKTGTIDFTTPVRVTSTLTQPGGAAVVGGENVTLQDQPAFEDRGAANAEINRYVGNAVNVVPTWMDCAAYDNQTGPVETPEPGLPTEQPEADGEYTVNDISVSGGEVTVNITRVSGEGGVAAAAAYAGDGTLIGVMFSDIETSEDTFDMTLSLNTEGAERIAAFVWNSIDGMMPISNIKEI